ncbi:MAG: PQQ-like beta-propeller repeat protein [Planctomycetota bacterium]|nr:PQQ-like beta-propeller repeat protein [Planctomycetota bacterium]
MKRRFFLTSVASAAGVCCVSNPLAGDDILWQSWRGPNRDGMLPGAAWPDSLDEKTLRQVWSQSFGDSYSGPVFSKDSIFTTETKSGKERVFCVSRTDGSTKWSYDWDGSMTVPFFAARNGSWIRSTPATDGKTLFVGGIRDVLVALDCEKGQELWRVDFGKLAGKIPDFGMACSPLIDGEYIYIQAGKGVHKLKASDGSIVWNALGDSGDMMTSGAFSSPVIQSLNGKRQLIVQSRTKLAGLDLETGKVDWSYEVAAFRGMNILTPTLWDNAIFTSSYGGRSLLLEVPNNESTKVRWENKIEGYMSSPIVVDHYIYMHMKNKRFACMDLQTGKETWVTKPFGEYWSMVSNGNRILALGHDGQLRLIAHNPKEFELLSERKVSNEESWAHLAVSGNQIAVRSQKNLLLFDWGT